MCPSYGSFYGDVVNDFGCCLDEKTCSIGLKGHKPLVLADIEDNSLPPLVRSKRFKRSIYSGEIYNFNVFQILASPSVNRLWFMFSGDMTKNKYQHIFDNILTSRSSGDAIKPLMEVSLCESKAEIIRPAFGTTYQTSNLIFTLDFPFFSFIGSPNF
jgi:hypothetical protein